MSAHSSSAEQFPHSILLAGLRMSQQRLVTEWESGDVQVMMRKARDTYSYALCCCRAASTLKLQIRTRGGKSHLAVWPEEGHEHDLRCVFFRDELAIAAMTQGHGDAAVPRGESREADAVPAHQTSEHRTRLRLIRAGFERISGEEGLSVRSLTYRLWHAASLCRWHPTWQRDWGRVRFELMRAASHYLLDGAPLEKSLFVPRVYRPEIKDRLDREWDEFVRSIQAHPRVPHLLVGQVRRTAEAGEGQPPRVMLRHTRHPIGLHTSCAEFLERECRSVLSSSALAVPEEQQADRPAVVGVFHVDASSRGGVWARAGWLMGVHAGTYIPASNTDSVRLVDALLREGHVFEHLMSETQSSQRFASEWIARHVCGPAGEPVSRAALQVLNAGSSAPFVEARNLIAQRMRERGIPMWTWVPSGRAGAAPLLPPLESHTLRDREARLDSIATSGSVEYGFGALSKLFSTHQPQKGIA